MTWTADTVAAAIDHTLLKPEATAAQIEKLCDEAVAYGFAAVCINPMWVKLAADRVSKATSGGGQSPAICTVAGFPLGANRSDVKADEARRAIDDGATEIDMVVALGALIDGDRATVRADIEAVSHAVHGAGDYILKVILETSALTRERILLGCRCCAEGEADFVKTSTGFHPEGGADIEHVQLMHRHATPLKVKASGGIRTADTALAMLEAGAARIGASAGVTIVDELRKRA
jgi:deoxyribose-phosphate aldolase